MMQMPATKVTVRWVVDGSTRYHGYIYLYELVDP